MDGRTVIQTGVSVVQIVVGSGFVFAGLRNRDPAFKPTAPLGAIFLILGISGLLTGTVPELILLPVELVLFIGGVIWFVREQRAVKRAN
jgi:hypothetical protein